MSMSTSMPPGAARLPPAWATQTAGGVRKAAATSGAAAPPPLPGAWDQVSGGQGNRPQLRAPRADARLDPAVTLAQLGDLGSAGSRMEEIAAVLQKANQAARQAARQERAELRDVATSADQKAADDIRSQAAFELAATCISSAISIVGAAVGLKGGFDGVEGEVPEEMQPEEMPEDETPIGPTASGTNAGDPDGIEMSDMDPSRIGKRAPAKVAADDGSPNAPKTADASADAKATKRAAWQEKEAAKAKLREAYQEKQRPRLQARLVRAQNVAHLLEEVGKIAGAGVRLGGAQYGADKTLQDSKASSARSHAEDETDIIHGYDQNIRSIEEKLAAMQQADAESKRQILSA